MKQKVIKPIVTMIAGLIVLSMLSGCAPMEKVTQTDKKPSGSVVSGTFSAADVGEDGWICVEQNGTKQLLIHPNETFIRVRDTINDIAWDSTPVGYEDDPFAKSKAKQQMASALLVTYINSKGSLDTSSSYVSSVRKNAFTIGKIDGGVRVEYTFEQEGFTIPVEYRLGEDYLDCTVITADILENSDNRVKEIALLPYFDAGSMQEDGYLLLPDGCGALLRFHNGKEMCSPYEAQVYGRDVNFDLNRSFEKKEQISLPVFGIAHTEHGTLTVITEGATAASIIGTAGGKTCGYTNAYVNFDILPEDTYTLGETVGSRVKVTTIFQKGETGYPSISTRTYLLSEEPDVASMALRYRRHLTEVQKVTPYLTGTLITVELVGAVQSRKPVLGIPRTVTEVLTTYQQAQEIIDSLLGQGVSDVSVLYDKWEASGISGIPPASLSPLGKLGGKRNLSDFRAFCDSKGIRLYVDTEWQVFSRWGNGYFSLFNGAKTISGNPAKLFNYDIATRFKEKDDYYSLLSPLAFTGLGQKLLENLNRLSLTGVATGSAGMLVYSDFRVDGYTRQDSANALVRTAELLKTGNKDLMVRGANDYLILAADELTDLPLDSSRFDVTDESVPFLQIVLSGLRTYSSEAFNLSSDADEAVLFAARTGSGLHYLLLPDSASDTLRGSSLNSLYSVSNTYWSSVAVAVFKKMAPLEEARKDSAINRYEILSPGLTLTGYENGVTVLVNSSDSSAEYQGHRALPRDFVFWEESR